MKRRGLALITTVLVIPILIVLGFCLTYSAVANLWDIQAAESSKRAAYATEAGAANAIAALKVNPEYEDKYLVNMLAVPETANVTILNNAFGTTTLVASNGAKVPPGFAYVLSDCRTRNQRVFRSTGVLVRLGENMYWTRAEFGNTSVTMGGGAKTDSYDSSLGTYATTQTNTGGSVGTNAVNPGAVNLEGTGTQVYGEVSVGVGGDSGVITTTGGAAYESVISLTEPFLMPPVIIPSSLMSDPQPAPSGTTSVTLSPGYYGDTEMKAGETLTLNAGVYVFDSLALSGNSNLVVSGKVTIFITAKNGKSLDMSGGTVANPSSQPKNLTFRVAGTEEVKVSGNSQAFFLVYAPRAPISVTGGTDIFGSLVGHSIDNHGGTWVHYDRSLNGTPSPPTAVTSWQRF